MTEISIIPCPTYLLLTIGNTKRLTKTCLLPTSYRYMIFTLQLLLILYCEFISCANPTNCPLPTATQSTIFLFLRIPYIWLPLLPHKKKFLISEGKGETILGRSEFFLSWMSKALFSSFWSYLFYPKCL